MPEHGTLYCYKRGCRRVECTAANRAWQQQRSRLSAYGRWNPYVASTPAREHVKALQAAGMGIRPIAAASGVGYSTITHLLYGKPSEGLAPSTKLRERTADAILSVRPALELYAPHSKVDGTGTRRRLRALAAIGWSFPRLADQLGMLPGTILRFFRTPNVEAATAIAVRDLYDKLWDSPPVPITTGDRVSVSKTLKHAAANGWVPPLAWDDETIDDPAAEPVSARYQPLRGKLPEADDIAHLIAGGASIAYLADRYQTTIDSIRQRLNRAKREGAAA